MATRMVLVAFLMFLLVEPTLASVSTSNMQGEVLKPIIAPQNDSINSAIAPTIAKTEEKGPNDIKNSILAQMKSQVESSPAVIISGIFTGLVFIAMLVVGYLIRKERNDAVAQLDNDVPEVENDFKWPARFVKPIITFCFSNMLSFFKTPSNIVFLLTTLVACIMGYVVDIAWKLNFFSGRGLILAFVVGLAEAAIAFVFCGFFFLLLRGEDVEGATKGMLTPATTSSLITSLLMFIIGLTNIRQYSATRWRTHDEFDFYDKLGIAVYSISGILGLGIFIWFMVSGELADKDGKIQQVNMVMGIICTILFFISVILFIVWAVITHKNNQANQHSAVVRAQQGRTASASRKSIVVHNANVRQQSRQVLSLTSVMPKPVSKPVLQLPQSGEGQ